MEAISVERWSYGASVAAMVGEIPLVSYNCVGGSPAGNPTYPKLNSGITVKRGSSPLYGYNIMAVAPW